MLPSSRLRAGGDRETERDGTGVWLAFNAVKAVWFDCLFVIMSLTTLPNIVKISWPYASAERAGTLITMG